MPPAAGWATVDAAAVGWDPVALQAAFDYAGEHASRAMVAAVGGRVVAQQSWGVDLGFARDVASVQKSVTALLVGNLADAGRVALTEPVATYLGAGWTRTTPAQEAKITVRHLLTMTSGLTDDLHFEAAPGTVWRYNTNAYQELPHVVEAVTHRTMEAVTRAELFDPIGVSGASGWRDRRGLGPFAADGNGRRIQGLLMTAPDMARVGLLVARGGDWGGRPVLTDPRYLATALNSSQDLNPSYGYLWWLNGKSAHVLPGPPRTEPRADHPDGTRGSRRRVGQGRPEDLRLQLARPRGDADRRQRRHRPLRRALRLRRRAVASTRRRRPVTESGRAEALLPGRVGSGPRGAASPLRSEELRGVAYRERSRESWHLPEHNGSTSPEAPWCVPHGTFRARSCAVIGAAP